METISLDEVLIKQQKWFVIALEASVEIDREKKHESSYAIGATELHYTCIVTDFIAIYKPKFKVLKMYNTVVVF